MENQSNLDLNLEPPEKTLTFSVGPYLMQETPSLRLLYENDEGLAYVQILDLDGETKNIVHSYFKVEKTLENIKKAREISMLIDEAFKHHGIPRLYTWSTSNEEKQYAEFMGYSLTGKQVVFEGWEGPPILEYVKELNH